MNRRTSFALFLLCLLVFLAASRVSAKDLFVDNDNGEATGSTIDLGRRSKVVVDTLKNNVIGGDKIDPKAVAVLNLDSGLGVFDAFFASLSMILVSEIGDETFIIAALMAMRHPKSIVLSGALSALFVMTFFMPFLGCGCFILLGDQIQKHPRRRRWKKWRRNWSLDKGKQVSGDSFLGSVLLYS